MTNITCAFFEQRLPSHPADSHGLPLDPPRTAILLLVYLINAMTSIVKVYQYMSVHHHLTAIIYATRYNRLAFTIYTAMQ